MPDPSLLDNQSEADVSHWKLYVFIAVGVLSAGGFGYFFSVLNVVGATIAGLALLAMLVLQTFFIKSKALSASIILGESLAATLPFMTRSFSYVLAAGVSLFVYLWLGNLQGKGQRVNQIKIRFFQVERLVSAKSLTGIALFISIFYVSGINLADPDLLRGSVRALIQPATPIVQKMINPAFSFDMTMRQFAGLIADQGVPPEQTLNALRAAYKVRFTDNETVTDALYNYATDRLAKIPENFRSYTPLAAVAIVFLIVKGFAVFIQWIMAPVTYLMYEALMALGFARVSLESRSREIILL